MASTQNLKKSQRHYQALWNIGVKFDNDLFAYGAIGHMIIIIFL